MRLPTFHIAKLGYYKNTTNAECLHHFLRARTWSIAGGREGRGLHLRAQSGLSKEEGLATSHPHVPGLRCSRATGPTPAPVTSAGHSSDGSVFPGTLEERSTDLTTPSNLPFPTSSSCTCDSCAGDYRLEYPLSPPRQYSSSGSWASHHVFTSFPPLPTMLPGTCEVFGTRLFHLYMCIIL